MILKAERHHHNVLWECGPIWCEEIVNEFDDQYRPLGWPAGTIRRRTYYLSLWLIAFGISTRWRRDQ